MDKCVAEEERKRKQDAERKSKMDDIAEKQKQCERELEEKERLRKEALIKEEAARVVSKPSEPNANKFVPRALRKAAESSGTEANIDSWRRGDRQTHVDGRDGQCHPIPRQRDADVPPSRDNYAPPPHKYEPPIRQTGKYEPPVSGRRDNYEPPRGRDAQPPVGRYERPKYGGFGNNRDERDRWKPNHELLEKGNTVTQSSR